MENKEIKITIDPNGNIQRKVVDKSQPEVKKPKFIKRIFSALNTSTQVIIYKMPNGRPITDGPHW